MATETTLYSYWRSSCSWRVRIALAYKGIPYKYVAVPLLEGKQRTADYAQLNPSMMVPTLMIDGNVLTQSLSILEYLEETHPLPPLLPSSHVQRAKVREIMQIIGSDIQPVQNLKILNKVAEFAGDDAKKALWAKQIIEAGFDALEAVLRSSAGKYCVGDQVTMADLCLVAQMYGARRFNVDIAKYPIITRIDGTLAEEDAFKKAHPSAQPDAVPQ